MFRSKTAVAVKGAVVGVASLADVELVGGVNAIAFFRELRGFHFLWRVLRGCFFLSWLLFWSLFVELELFGVLCFVVLMRLGDSFLRFF